MQVDKEHDFLVGTFLSPLYLGIPSSFSHTPRPLLPPKQESTSKRIVHVIFFFGGGGRVGGGKGENKVVGYIYERLNHIL